MIKGFVLIPKRPDLTDDQFHHHWQIEHAPLAKRLKTLRRYIQAHQSEQQVPGFSLMLTGLYFSECLQDSFRCEWLG